MNGDVDFQERKRYLPGLDHTAVNTAAFVLMEAPAAEIVASQDVFEHLLRSGVF